MEDAVTSGGELMLGMAAALVVIGAVMLLLSRTDAGILRMYLTALLESAC